MEPCAAGNSMNPGDSTLGTVTPRASAFAGTVVQRGWSRLAPAAAPDSARVAPARPSASPAAAVRRLKLAIRDHSSWSGHQESSEAPGRPGASQVSRRFPPGERCAGLPACTPPTGQQEVGRTRIGHVVLRSVEADLRQRSSVPWYYR